MPGIATKKAPSHLAAPCIVTNSKAGLSVTAYRGDGSVLLAFNLDDTPKPGFAGFAIKCTPPKGAAFYLKNRLSFDKPNTAETSAEEHHQNLTTSDQAPYQKFRWADFSSWKDPGTYTYEVSAMYRQNNKLTPKATVAVSIELGPFASGNLQVGFTRGFLSSQAYVDQFHNAPIRPAKKSIDYPTKKFEPQYEWLGFHARKLVFDFLNEVLEDDESELDVFAYDLDEPDVIRTLEKFGGRLRAFLDDAPLHTKTGAMEILAKKALIKSAGEENVKSGHYTRFAHNKVFIQKKNGKPMRVLTGSANFSVRGLYVQANNVLVFNDPGTATQYENAFEQTFTDMQHFASSEIAEGWVDLSHEPSVPPFSVAFSPHKSSDVSLSRVAAAVKNAKSSVFFAIMELGGGGPVLEEIKGLASVNKVFSYGVTQNLSGASLYAPGSSNGILTPFAFLKQHAPFPFNDEIDGGLGQVIHDKFVVVDFDTDNPLVYTGSSNLAAGGEQHNGDNLMEIRDKAVASIFAVQAVGLVDHFHFRAAMKNATDQQPLLLANSDSWWEPYYKKGTIKYRDRNLFCPAAAHSGGR